MKKMSDRDPLYLFLCGLEWRNRGTLSAHAELVEALSDGDPAIRALAEDLIQYFSQGPKWRGAEHQASRIEP